MQSNTGLVALRSSQGLRQSFGIHLLDVARRTRLDAPAFGQGTDINHVEAEPIDQLSDLGLRRCVVSGDGKRSSVPRTRRW